LRRAVAAAFLVALVVPAQAAAKSFTLPQASVTVTVGPDGVLDVTERITFRFDGPFTGAFREIPMRSGELLAQPYVQEGTQRYHPGASAELGSSGARDTYGIARTNKGVRIVWHFSAQDETRTFTVGYRLAGLAVAYDDVVDVNLKVWGDEWKQDLGQLTASLRLPGKARAAAYRVWGHPVWVRGDVQRFAGLSTLRAQNIPAGQWVELRVVFPRRLLTSTDGVIVRPGKGLPKILAEEATGASAYTNDQRKIHEWVHHPGRTALVLLVLGLGPTALILLATWLLYGRERRGTYDREYEQEPPSDLAPALVPALVTERPKIGSLEFTATLFDLIRRGRYKATPTTTAPCRSPTTFSRSYVTESARTARRTARASSRSRTPSSERSRRTAGSTTAA
jgi:hypothetical protein